MSSFLRLTNFFRKPEIGTWILGPLSVVLMAAILCPCSVWAWQMKRDSMMTQWSMVNGVSQLDPANILPEYPRPQMRRQSSTWMNLNGIWQLQKGTDTTQAPPAAGTTLTGDILVPFCIESAISGVENKSYMNSWYRRLFTVPAAWLDGTKKILLHFDAVDHVTRVYLNGTLIGRHTGGYDRFSFDITSLMKNNGQGQQELTLGVYDPTSQLGNNFPRGKQKYELDPGCFYYPCTGIWRTVWLEAVPATAYISKLRLTPDVDNTQIKVFASITGTLTGTKVVAIAKNSGLGMFGLDSAVAGDTVKVKLSALNLWWPDRPYLYHLGVYLVQNGTIIDSVQSYFGMRKVSKLPVNGVNRIGINGQPIYLCGDLDQGYWPDGIYTAPTDAALKNDIVLQKQWGLNGIRKHVKIECDRWYYYCDSIGMMVENDMAGIGEGSNGGPSPTNLGRATFAVDLDSMAAQHYNNPSIIMWIVFNESWGIDNTTTDIARLNNLVDSLRKHDPTRLINPESSSLNGDPSSTHGDVMDLHNYPSPVALTADPTFIVQLGEYGGIHLDLTSFPTHLWLSPYGDYASSCEWGYVNATSQTDWGNTFTAYAQSLKTYKTSSGNAASIYTQFSDVQCESNGLTTYDRAMTKCPLATIQAATALLVDHPTVAAYVPPKDSVPGPYYTGTNQPYRQFNFKPLRLGNIFSVNRSLMVNVIGRDVLDVCTIRLFDIAGKTVFEKKVAGTGTVIIPAGTVARGVDFIELKNGTSKQIVPCVVK
jgi:beta-galactosidase/beta-glucuronidase